MSYHPSDLVTDTDLLAYEGTILDQFDKGSWLTKRTKALEDWLFPVLESRGFPPEQLRTRYDPATAFGFTGAAWSDQTAAAKETTVDDIDLAAIFATPSTDFLYLGSASQFMGLHLNMADSPSTANGVMTVTYWNGAWTDVVIADGTVAEATPGRTLSAGGTVSWTLQPDWTRRVVNGSDRLYWARVALSATPTSATVGQIATVRASRLRGATTFRTLHLIFAEAPTGQEGPWAEKASFYEDQADRALTRALPLIGGEFDTDDTDQVSTTEEAQTAEEVGGGGGLVMERG